MAPNLPEGFNPEEWNWSQPRPLESWIKFREDRDCPHGRIGDGEDAAFIRDGMVYIAYRRCRDA